MLTTWAVIDTDGYVIRMERCDGEPPDIGLYTAESVDDSLWRTLQPPEGQKARLVKGTFEYIDTRTLDEIKAAKQAEIKAAKEAANDAPKVTTYGTFDATQTARANLSTVVTMAQTADKLGLPSSVKFTLADNSRVEFTLAEIEGAAMQIEKQVAINLDHADTLRKQIEAATTAEEVNAISW